MPYIFTNVQWVLDVPQSPILTMHGFKLSENLNNFADLPYRQQNVPLNIKSTDRIPVLVLRQTPRSPEASLITSAG